MGATFDGITYPPFGRCHMTMKEFMAEFGTNDHRKTLLQEVVLAINLWREIARVPKVWFAGSFVSDKEAPSDIDMTLFFWDGFLPLETRRQHMLATGLPRASGDNFRKLTGLRMDLYAVNISPYELAPITLDDEEYVRSRGYWDDWWERIRETGPVQARGYVEVLIDGYPTIPETS